MEFQLGEADKQKIDEIHKNHHKYNSLENQQVIDYIAKRIKESGIEAVGAAESYTIFLKQGVDEYYKSKESISQLESKLPDNGAGKKDYQSFVNGLMEDIGDKPDDKQYPKLKELPTPQPAFPEQNLENLVEIIGLPDESKIGSAPTPSRIFGVNIDDKSYKPMEEINQFIEETAKKFVAEKDVAEQDRKNVLEYLNRMTEGISSTPKYYAHLEGSRKYFNPKIISEFIRGCINGYFACKEEGIKLASSPTELIEEYQLRENIAGRCEAFGIKNQEIVDSLEEKVKNVAEEMKIRNTIPITIINRIINDVIPEDLKRELTKPEESKVYGKKSAGVHLPTASMTNVPPEEADFKKEIRTPPNSKKVVKAKIGIGGLLAGITITGGIATSILYSVMAFNNSKINSNYDKTREKIESSFAQTREQIESSIVQTVDNRIKLKINEYTPKSLEEAIYRGQVESLVNIRKDLDKQQKEINEITKKYAEKISSLEKRKDLTLDFEQLSEEQKKSQQNYNSLEQYVNDIIKKINSLETSDSSTAQEITKLEEKYQKDLSGLGKTIESLEKEFGSKGIIIEERILERIKEAEVKFKEGLAYLKSSFEKYIKEHKEEHKPKEVVKPKKEEPVIIMPVPIPEIPEDILRKLEELKSR